MEYGTVPILKLLANEVRFNALVMLGEKRQGAPVGISAGVIAEHCGVSASACSQALSLLQLAGLVTVERRGTARIYRMSDPVHPLVAAALAYDAGREA